MGVRVRSLDVRVEGPWFRRAGEGQIKVRGRYPPRFS